MVGKLNLSQFQQFGSAKAVTTPPGQEIPRRNQGRDSTMNPLWRSSLTSKDVMFTEGGLLNTAPQQRRRQEDLFGGSMRLSGIVHHARDDDRLEMANSVPNMAFNHHHHHHHQDEEKLQFSLEKTPSASGGMRSSINKPGSGDGAVKDVKVHHHHSKRRNAMHDIKDTTDQGAQKMFLNTKFLLSPVPKNPEGDPMDEDDDKHYKLNLRRNATATPKDTTDSDAECLFQNTKALLQPVPRGQRRASLPTDIHKKLHHHQKQQHQQHQQPQPPPTEQSRLVPKSQKRFSMPTKLPSHDYAAESLFQGTKALLKPVPKKKAPTPPPSPPPQEEEEEVEQVIEEDEVVEEEEEEEVIDEEEEEEEEVFEEAVVEVELPAMEEPEEEPPVVTSPVEVEEPEPVPEPIQGVVEEEEPAPPKEDETTVSVGTSDVFVAFTMPECQSEPSDKAYRVLELLTQKFYTSHLKKRFKSTFQEVQVTKHRSYFGEDKPTKDYNVYIEWDVRAKFEAGNDDAPDRLELCQALVKVNLMKYLTKVAGLTGTPFAKVNGVYTHQTNSCKSEE